MSGHGNHANVACVKDEGGKNVIIKADLYEASSSELEAEAAAYAALLPLQGKEVPKLLAIGKVLVYGEKHDAIALEYIDGDARGLADECKSKHIRNGIMLLFQKIWDLGVVHGDVAFRNIGRRKCGQLVLLDFGCASVNATQQQIDDEEQDVTALLGRPSDEDVETVVGLRDAMTS